MLVRECMTPDPLTVNTDDSFLDALKLIRKERIRHLPVVDGRRLAGVVTDRDLRQAAPSPATSLEIHEVNFLLERLKIETVMTRKVITVRPESRLADAAQLLVDHRIGCLPVLDRVELVGILTRGDILHAYVEQERQRAAVPNEEFLIEDRPGALDVLAAATRAGSATAVAGTAVGQGSRRPVLVVRVPGAVAGEVRERLTATGHAPVEL